MFFIPFQVLWKFFIIFYKIYSPMSSSQTELVELSDFSPESNVKDTLAQTPPKKKAKLAKRYCVLQSEWLKEEGMSWLSKVDDFTANCMLLNFFVALQRLYAS